MRTLRVQIGTSLPVEDVKLLEETYLGESMASILRRILTLHCREIRHGR